MFEEIVFNREELYEEVWSAPMSSLSKKYSISDVGLAKICKKLKIPVPGRGYWAKGVMSKPTLPSLKYGDPSAHTLRREKIDVLPIDEAHEAEAQPLIAFEEDPINNIQVHERLKSPHPLVERTLNALKEGRTDTYGRIYLTSDKCFNVSITRNSVGKAMRILDAVLKSFDKRGFALSLGTDAQNSSKDRNLTRVTILKQKIEISLDEPVKKVERILSPAEEKDRLKHPWKYEKYMYVPSGEIALKINNVYWGEIRHTWSDGKTGRLEHCLNDFMIGLIRASSVLRSVELKWEIERNERQDREQKRAAEEKRIQEEQERLSRLLQDVENWDKSRRIRAYIDAVREKVTHDHGVVTTDSQMEKWFAWAIKVADQLDPLCGQKLPCNSLDLH